MKKIEALFTALIVASALAAAAEEKDPAAKDDEKPKGGWSADTWSGLELRGIGPAVTSGRIADIAVDPTTPETVVPGRRLGRRLEDGRTPAPPGPRSSTARAPTRSAA